MRMGVDAAVVGGELVDGDVEVVDGVLVAVGRPPAGSGAIAVPGLVDLQVNGFGGVDLLSADADAIVAADRALRATGVLAWQPTLITSDIEQMRRAITLIAEVAASGGAPGIVGVHLEGPFLAPTRLGTHPARHRRDPDLALLRSLLDAGDVRTVTLAPELDGALAMIELLRDRGVLVALGHSDATAAQAHAGFDAGARTVTHLFNAMRRFSPRDPGLAGAALGRREVSLQLIVDGIHLADDTVRLVWEAGRGRTVLVTDAIAAAGLGDGLCRLGEVEVHVRDGEARRADGTLAGSVLTMPEAIRNAVALGVPLTEAVDAASRRPAQLLGRPALGELSIGAPARGVILDADLQVQRVIDGPRVAEVPA